MSDAFWMYFFIGLPGMITAAGAVVISLLQLWLGRKVDKIGREMNGMKDALVKVTGEAEKAKGRIEGANEERTHPTAGPTNPTG